MVQVIKTQLFLFALLAFASTASAQCGALISTFPYTEDFEAAPAWTSGGTNSDWAWGTPAHPIINTAGGGTKSWTVGGLSGSFYNYSEQSWIMSPCFDFTTLNYPWISFKIFWEDEWKYDGLVLQYSLTGGTTWTNVGAYGDAVNCLNDNWYDYNNITWLTTASPKDGWSGRTGATVGSCQGGHGSLGWVTAKHCMSSLAGQPSVRFRFLFGSGTTCNGYDGISVDDILIDNAPPNVANFTYACAGANTINFTNASLMCPTGYSWDFGDGATSTVTSPSHTYLAPGTYSVTLTSSGPCNAPSSITIPVTILGVNTTSANITCNGANDGTATANVIGGTGTFNYSWTPGGATTAAITGLTPGTYTVAVSAAGSCSASGTVTITQPGPLTATAAATPVNCFGGADGTAAVTVTGGTTPYTYSWTPSGGTAANATGLAAGTYTITVTDAHSCTANATTVITQPAAALAVTTTNTSALCGASNGTANSTVTGGTTPYTYLWSPSGGTAANATALAPGTYTLTVTDAHSCSAISTTTILNTGGASATSTATPVLCFGGTTGTATVTATGGTTPYTYSWSPSGGTAATASGLAAGTYTVTVTDAHSCPTTSTITVTQPASALNATTVNTSVNCFGGTDGTATVTAAGGTPAYSYTWTTGSTTINASGLSAGTYTVTVTDANSCTTMATTTVTQPLSLTASTSNTPVSCFAGTNGTATALVSGGTPAYTYAWSPSGGTHANASGLSSGTYTVTITDAHSCSTTATTTVTQPSTALTITATGNGTTCGASNGTAASIAAGGTTPYAYFWSPSGGTASTASGLAPGAYSINVTDANGCITSANTIISSSTGISAAITSTPVLCHNDSTGSAIASATGGTGSYSYAWSSGQTTSSIIHLSSGNYCVIATDAAGCKDTSCIDLTNPAPFIVDFTSDPTVTDIYNPEIHFTEQAPGSTAWQWNFGDTTGSTGADPVHTYNTEGTYPVLLIATNAQGCVDSVIHEITINDGFTFYAPNAFTPNGNGNNDIFLPKGTGWDAGTFNLWVFDRWGNNIFHSTNVDIGWTGKANNGSDIAQTDVYVWKVQLSDTTGRKHHYLGSVSIVQ